MMAFDVDAARAIIKDWRIGGSGYFREQLGLACDEIMELRAANTESKKQIDSLCNVIARDQKFWDEDKAELEAAEAKLAEFRAANAELEKTLHHEKVDNGRHLVRAWSDKRAAEAKLARYREALESICTYRSDEPDWNMVLAIAKDAINPLEAVLSDTPEAKESEGE